MAMSAKAIRQFAERHRIPFLPPDHPEFKSGPQIHFLSRTSSQSGRKGSGSTMPAGNTSAEQPENNDES
jgi:hypothetical protein